MRKLLGVSIVSLVLVSPLFWYLISQHVITSEDAPSQRHPSDGDHTPTKRDMDDDELKARVQELEDEIQIMLERIDTIDEQLLDLQRSDSSPSYEETEPWVRTDPIVNDYADVVLIARRRSVNRGLSVASTKFRVGLFGMPRNDLSDDCAHLTNEKLVGLLRREKVGPIRVELIAPAVDSLRQVFTGVEEHYPELHKRIKSSGSLCVRWIRGSRSSISAHAFGLALDINIDGDLDELADGRTQIGLTILADFFKAEGWIWGAGFTREDSMHFEISKEKLQDWRRAGKI